MTPVADVTGVPEMLDHRVVTLHPKIHGGILADRGKESHRADLETHGIAPFDLVVSNLYPFLERPDIETIDIGGPAMVRAAAKNHAWVGIVTEPRPVRPGARRAARQRRRAVRRHAPRARVRGVRAHRRVRRRDRALARRRRGAARSTSCSRSSAPSEELRYGENPHQQAARYRLAGTTSWWDGVEQHSGLALCRTSTSTTPTRRGDSCTISGPTGVRHHQARQPVWCRGRRRSRRPRTSARSSATSAPRSAASSR